MAILGKVAGTMLKDNLVRNGVDLQIDSNLMYYDVANRRVGVNTTLPGNALTVNGNATVSSIFSNTYYWGNGSPFTSSSYSNADVCAFTKELGAEKVFVAVNLRNETLNYTLPAAVANSTFKNAMNGILVTTTTQLNLPPYSYVVYEK
jgi:hypothetical protein